MKRPPKTGTNAAVAFTVCAEHTIDVLGQPELAVLSTPTLIWYLEQAARDALEPWLEANETSVGTQVDIRHLAATPKGFKVVCSARVIQVDQAVISFQVSASDGHDTIARGLHQRRVVVVDRMARRLREKLAKGKASSKK